MPTYPKGNKFITKFMVAGKRHTKMHDTDAEGQAWELKARAALLVGKPLPVDDEKPVRSVGGRDSGTLAQVKRTADTMHWSRLKGSKKQSMNAQTFVDWAGPRLSPSEAFAQSKVDEFFQYLVEVRKVSNSTLNRYSSAVSGLIKFAKLPKDRKPELPWFKEGKGRVRFLTDEEEGVILQTLSLWGMHRERDLVVFLLDTGARPWSEATAFTYKQQREGRGFIPADRKVTFDDTKNDITRTLPLTVRAWDAVQRAPKDQAGPFTDLDSTRMDHVWDRLRAHIPGLADTVVYTCRHTCASRLVMRGVDIRRVKEWMGHTTIVTTMKYAHLAPTALLDVGAVLEPGGGAKLRVVDNRG